MRDHFYAVPTAVLAVNSPAAGFHALVCPDMPTYSLVVVTAWNSVSEQDAWESLAGVITLHLEDMGTAAPPAIINAFGSWGAVPLMTRRQVLQLIRRQWPAVRL